MKLARGAGALAHRSFLIYSIGNWLSSVGLWVQKLGTAWLAWTLSGSEFWVGLVAFASFAPVLFFSAFFGVIIDRMDVRVASMIVNLLTMVWAVLLAALTWLDLMSVELLFILSLLVGLTNAAYAPVRLSLVPSLVPRELMSSAVAINSMIFNVSRLVGPAIAGLVLATSSAAWAFAINAISYLPLVYALSIIRITPAERSAAQREGFWAQLGEGLAHARDSHLIFWQLLITFSMAAFGRAILEVLPIYATGLYNEGAAALASLALAAGVGALAAAFTCSRLELHNRQIQIATIALGLMCGGALFLVPLSGSLIFGLVVFSLIGFASTGSGILSQTLVQMEVQDSLRARVSSLWGMAGLGGTAFGSLLLGSLLALMDVLWATWITAAVSLLLPLFAWGAVRRRNAARPSGLSAP